MTGYESQNPPMNVDPESSKRSAPVPARRKLIRGAFALPVVASVHSGSALANSSSLRCLANQQGTTFPGVTASPDHYMRVELAALVPNGNGQAPTYYVEGSRMQNLPFKRSATYTLGSSQWQGFSMMNNTDVGGLVVTSQPSSSGNSAQYKSNSGKFAALRFDDLGNLTGVGESASSMAMTGTCWNSMSGVKVV